MSHIFWLCRDFSQPKDDGSDVSLVYPSVFLRVCSRWRQIAFASAKLWSHIDIDIGYPPTRVRRPAFDSVRRFTRAKLFVAQSNQFPLDLCMVAPLCKYRESAGLTEFSQSTWIERVRSFELCCAWPGAFLGFRGSWLGGLLSKLVAGTLTQLCLKVRDRGSGSGFLVAADSTLTGRSYIRVSVAEQQLEELLLSVTSLKVIGLYPVWTSLAYSGLVELIIGSVNSAGADPSMTDLEFVAILRASPSLRVFHFGLSIRPSQGTQLPDAVELNDLNSLQLTSGNRIYQSRALLLVRPGRNPLDVTIGVTATSDGQIGLPSLSWAEFVNFTNLSEIVSLRIKADPKQQPRIYGKVNFDPLDVLPLLPRLEVLVLDGFLLGQECEAFLGGYDATSYLSMLTGYDRLPHHQLRVLILVGCKIYWSDIRHVPEIHPTEKLVLDRCQVNIHYSRKSDFKGALESIAPVVETCETEEFHEDDID